MAVLNSNNVNLISQTPALGRVYSNGTQPQIKGAFIYRNGQPTQVYPPILPVSLTRYNVYTDVAVTVTNYTIISITIESYTGYYGQNAYGDTVMYGQVSWRASQALPTRLTLYYTIDVEGREFNGYYSNYFSDYANGTVYANSGYTSGTIWFSYNDFPTEEYTIESIVGADIGINGYYQHYYIYNNTYYIYISGQATPPAPSSSVSGSTTYVYFTAYMNNLPKYLSYTGNIYSLQNLFNLTYMNDSSYSTMYQSYTLTQYPSSSANCYFTIDGTNTGNTIPIANADGYSNATRAITRNLYMKNIPFRCPTIGYTYISTSYNVNRSDFGYYFCGYFSTNTSIVPWSGDPMIDSSYALFDYNSSTRVTRYKVRLPYTKMGWITERLMNKFTIARYNWDGWAGYPNGNDLFFGSTRAINNGQRFIYLSTSSSLTFKVESEGSYADIETGTFYISNTTGKTVTESFGWSSGGARAYYNNSRYLMHGGNGSTSMSYPCWNLWYPNNPDYTDTSREYTIYMHYGTGTEAQTTTFLNYIYTSLTVTLHVEDRALANNFTFTDSGTRASIGMEYTYRHTPITVYVYEVGASTSTVRQVTFVAKRLGSFQLYYTASECSYVVRELNTN